MGQLFDTNIRFLRIVAFVLALACVGVMMAISMGVITLPEGLGWLRLALGVFVGALALLSCLVLLLVKDRKRTGDVLLDSEHRITSDSGLDQARQILRAVAGSLAELVDSLSGRTKAEGERIDTHSAAIIETMDLKDLREVQQRILDELAALKRENHQVNEGLVGIRGKITSQEQKIAHFEEEVMIDHLTTVPNRRSLDKRIREETDRAGRYAGELSVIMIDIDDFKALNDQFGHLAGDRVLRGIANVMVSETRTSDFIARYGGEEFVVLLPGTMLEQATVVAEKLRSTLDAVIFRLEDKRVHVTASFGVAQRRSDESPEDMLSRADAAQYVAKRRGRNTVCTESDIDDA